MNKLLYSEEELNKFLSVYPDLEKDEVYFLALFQRNKHLSAEDRKEYGLPRSNVIARAIVRSKESVAKQIRRWETNEKGFLTKNNLPIPNECIVPYFTINPVSVVKGYVDFNKIFTDYIVELASNNNRENTYDRIKKADTLLLDCFQHAYGRKLFIDVDFDIPMENWGGFYLFENILKSKKVVFHKVQTAGGFHYLLRTDTIKYNYNETLQTIREEAVKSSFATDKWEIEINKNQALPLPGTYQYGSFEVKLIT